MLENLSIYEQIDINGGCSTSKDPAVNRGLQIGCFIGETIRETLKIINPFNFMK